MIRALLLVTVSLALATPAAASPAPPVTVLSFNIHHAAGVDGVFDLDRLATEIRDSGADVVGLQEVDRHYGDRSSWTDEPAELSRRLGMHVVFGANLDLEPPAPGEPRRQYGTAILSRYPIVSWRNTLLPKGDPAEEQRGLLSAVLVVHGHRLRFMTTHFQHDSAVARELQATEVASHVRASREPVVLTGDLNAPPDKPEVTTLTAILTDTFASAGQGDGFTHPADAPTARIDYVLAALRPVRSTVLATESSDHRPVRTTLRR
ncbi:MAG TPA: endonuclease/exonuclease/phosphatase family protein [Actinophytocola sp.]|jgi:endonuclease/exonuclease/phosphatase family metal-dependent hydrolase|uniref:endonuclease/exonuclease/phosphatase family protein n=1 Tax=Actinophytocola sp. TaxID=1872138 RepID=UPI002F93165D